MSLDHPCECTMVGFAADEHCILKSGPRTVGGTEGRKEGIGLPVSGHPDDLIAVAIHVWAASGKRGQLSSICR